MRYLFTLALCFLISTSATAQGMSQLGFEFGIGPTYFDGEDVVNQTAVSSMSGAAKVMRDTKHIQFGFSVELFSEVNGVKAVHVRTGGYRGSDTIIRNLDDGPFVTPNVFVNCKVAKWKKMFGYVGGSLGIPLIAENEAQKYLRYGAEVGVVWRLGKVVIIDILLYERWRYIHQDGSSFDNPGTGYSATTSGAYFMNAFNTCVGIRVPLVKKYKLRQALHEDS